jgi:hypothetical protein
MTNLIGNNFGQFLAFRLLRSPIPGNCKSVQRPALEAGQKSASIPKTQKTNPGNGNY